MISFILAGFAVWGARDIAIRCADYVRLRRAKRRIWRRIQSEIAKDNALYMHFAHFDRHCNHHDTCPEHPTGFHCARCCPAIATGYTRGNINPVDNDNP